MAVLSSVTLLPSPSHFNTNLYRSSSSSSIPFSLFNIQSRRPLSTLISKANAVSSPSTISRLSSTSVGEDLPSDYEDWLPKRQGKRRAGILLHPTSFRGPHGIGDLGDEAFRFIDWLHHSGCSVWQVLPLVPPDEGGSPYSGQDANCGNTLLISLEELVKDGLLTKDELPERVCSDRVNFSAVTELKNPLIAKAAERLILSDGELKIQFEDFRKDPNISSWLEDAAYFAAIDDTLNTLNWYDWPESLKNRHLAALEGIYQSKKDFIEIFIAQQFLFQRQWQKVRSYAQEKGISIMGDMPIYVGYHSADVWANKRHFLLNRKGFPLLVSGVPPDAFSNTGQLWGSPLYDWEAMERDNYSWWVCRIQRAQHLYNEFRIDHFRGFAGYWAVPSDAKVAMVGNWKAGPGKSLFDAITRAVGKISIIAEDLGVITEDVVQLRKSIGAPGMAVLQFGFGSDADNPHLPHNHDANQVVYTGTHDNDTIRGWWDVIKQEEKSNVLKYLSIAEEDEIPWALIKAALSSVAETAVIPLQDILGLGNSARMNIPATQLEQGHIWIGSARLVLVLLLVPNQSTSRSTKQVKLGVEQS
ncbi:4-alpha-glucanotransferase, chloroplast precursor, putative [Ricinus communis]|uniref:4-alpha-glucanotransferase n=1 Tax=Ricinus communis TaxID=3988 RepID=B9SRR2_RICCO|nr:4-alpha-glucanotransferase, chloroplast precursor, putative [Ricinus communis]|eukprot:XP_002528681.1 4-alpha-glucanotransferase DPE1, chloroplastic/amyloplastic isoform X1 [Ricinus communis]